MAIRAAGIAGAVVALTAGAVTLTASAGVDTRQRVASGDTWYVATGGDNDGAGTSDDPFATWQRGIRAARAGDRVVVRAGTYRAKPGGVDVQRSGRRSAPITFEAENPGDRPVLDCSGLAVDRATCLEIDGSWWRFTDIDVIGTPQPTADAPVAVLLDGADHVRIERVAVHDNEGIGIALYDDSRHNVLRDCDAYANAGEKTDPPYENADGVDLAGLAPKAVGNRVVRCRFWWNSDDGIDLWESEVPVTIRRSWSFLNGYVPGTTTPAGNGQGFKLGRNFDGPEHFLKRNLAFANRTYGFDQNGAAGPMALYHNTAYANGEGQFAFYGGLPDVLRNNVAVPKQNELTGDVDDDFNSWTLRVRASERDFRSVSWKGTNGPRDADGSLPRLPFLRLTATSDLVDAGTDLGLPYDGAAPDLGAYERR